MKYCPDCGYKGEAGYCPFCGKKTISECQLIARIEFMKRAIKSRSKEYEEVVSEVKKLTKSWEPICPNCGSDNTSLLVIPRRLIPKNIFENFVKWEDLIETWECKDCGHIFLNPESIKRATEWEKKDKK